MAQYEKQHKPDKKLLASLGAHIRTIREKKGLTIEQLSTKADINFKYLQRCETGKVNFSISVLFAIAKGLEITPESLITYTKSTELKYSLLKTEIDLLTLQSFLVLYEFVKELSLHFELEKEREMHEYDIDINESKIPELNKLLDKEELNIARYHALKFLVGNDVFSCQSLELEELNPEYGLWLEDKRKFRFIFEYCQCKYESLYPNSAQSFKITYIEPNREIYINNILITQLQVDSIPRTFFEYIFKHAGDHIKYSSIQDEIKQCLKKEWVPSKNNANKVLNGIGFKDDQLQAFFELRKDYLCFHEYIDSKRLQDLNIKTLSF